MRDFNGKLVREGSANWVKFWRQIDKSRSLELQSLLRVGWELTVEFPGGWIRRCQVTRVEVRDGMISVGVRDLSTDLPTDGGPEA